MLLQQLVNQTHPIIELLKILIPSIVGSSVFVALITNSFNKRATKKSEMSILKDEISEIKTQLKIVSNQLNLFLKHTNFKVELKNALEIKSEQILSSHYDLNSNIKTLLLSGRNSTMYLAKFVYFSKSEITKESIMTEISNIFDNMKIIVKSYFPEIRKVYINDDFIGDLTFSQFFRNYSEMNNLSFALVSSILEFKSGFWNGEADKKLIEYFCSFLQKAYLEGIKAYKIFIKFKIVGCE